MFPLELKDNICVISVSLGKAHGRVIKRDVGMMFSNL